MASMTERLMLLIDARSEGATRELKKLSGEAGKTDDATKKLSTSATMMGTAFKTAAVIGIGIATVKLIQFAGDALQAASNLEETQNKVGVVFGESADQVRAFGEDAAKSMGMSEDAALGAAATFGQFFDAAGLSAKAAAGMSQEMVQLASDMASFNNADPSMVLENLRSGLAGEAEPLRKFGVFLNEAAVQAKAMELGIAAAGEKLTDQQKIQARYALILEQTTTAQGDFARTSGSLANQQRILSASVEDLKAGLGEALMPAMKSAVGVANDLLGAFTSLPTGVQQSTVALAAVGGIAAVTIPKIIELRKALEGVDKTALAKGLGKAGLAVGLLAIAGAAATAAGKASELADSFDDALRAFSSGAGDIDQAKQALDGLIARQDDLAHNTSLWDTFGDTIGSTVEEFKHLTGGKDLIDEISDATQRLADEQMKYNSVLAAVQAQTGLSESQAKKLAETYGLDLTQGMQAASDALVHQYQATIDTTAAQQGLSEVTQTLLDPLAEAKDKADAYTAAITMMTSAVLGVTNAEIGFQGSIDDLQGFMAELTAATQEGDAATRAKAQADLAAATALDLEEESGRKVVTNLGKLAEEAARVASEEYKKTGSVDAATAAYKTHVGQIDKVIQELGLNKEEVKKLIGQYDQVPSDITTAVRVETGQASGAIATWRQILDNIPRSVTTYLRAVQASNVPAALQPRAAGGPVTGGEGYLVGEKGPEFFIPESSGQIIPNGRLTGSPGGMGGGRGMTVNVYVAGSIRGDRELARTVRDELARFGRRGDPMAA